MKTQTEQAARMKADATKERARAELRMRRDAMISSVAETVATDWYRRCVRSQQRMALYWRQTRNGENAACPIIDVSAPNDSFEKHCDISPAMSRDRVRQIVADAMRELPMLSAYWFQV